MNCVEYKKLYNVLYYDIQLSSSEIERVEEKCGIISVPGEAEWKNPEGQKRLYICSNCKRKLNVKEKYCGMCGSKMINAPGWKKG